MLREAIELRRQQLAEHILLQHVRSKGLPVPVCGAVSTQYDVAVRNTARQSVELADEFLKALEETS